MSRNEAFTPWQCPLCGGALQGETDLKCEKGHCFDRAREGYWHLLPVQSMRTKAPGDSKEMVAARRAFLNAGYYGIFGQALGKLCLAHGVPAAKDAPLHLLDAGCGEGWYTAGVYQALRSAGKTPRMAGTDISKFILRYASKREKGVEFAVASSYRLPMADGSLDILLNCFSPLALEEFRRVLRPGGTFLYVVPAADHLWELKKVLYDRPYPNEEKETPYEGFAYEAIVPVDQRITLESQSDIHALFQMTPYYWKTPKAGAERLAELNRLDCRIAFRVHIFRKL